MFTGSYPALITPFKDGALDLNALKKLVEWHIAEGSHGLVPVGTTGESPTVSHEEHMTVVSEVVKAAAGRIKVIAGAGSNSTAEGVDLIKHAEATGADGALVVSPYFNNPTLRGMVAHFAAMHDACALPIIIYNIPGRSVVDMMPDTMAELAKLPRIVGVKDATGDLARRSMLSAAEGALSLGPPLAAVALALFPRALASGLAVLLLAGLAGVTALVLAYLTVYGFSPWGLPAYTHAVGGIFSPAVGLIFALKTGLFALAVAVVPLAAAARPDAAGRFRRQSDMASFARLFSALLLIEVGSLLGNYA